MNYVTSLFFGLFTVVFACSCGRDLSLKTPAKKPIKLNENVDSLTISLKDFDSAPTSVSMFFLPDESELVWESDLYQKSDRYQDKIAKIMKTAIRNSDEWDLAAIKSDELSVKVNENSGEYRRLGCSREANRQLPRCIELEKTKNDFINNQKYQEELISKIILALDGPVVQGDADKSINWLNAKTPENFKFVRLEDGSFDIRFFELGPGLSIQNYSTENGEIFNVKSEKSEYNSKIELLKFKVKEKDLEGRFTDYVWEFTLESSFVFRKLRYKGDVLRLDSRGNVVKRGIFKMDFAKKNN